MNIYDCPNTARQMKNMTGVNLTQFVRSNTDHYNLLYVKPIFLIILPGTNNEESTVNRIVALLDLDGGVMKEGMFVIDTQKIWMHGKSTVKFTVEHVQLSLYPWPKTARLFAWQATIRVTENFNDTGLTINPVDLSAAYASFIMSPLHVPVRRVFGDKVPEDASAICEQLYDREYVRKLKEKMKAE